MSNRELAFAIFYNFKEEESCPFCKLVKTVYDKGGAKLVLERLGVFNSDRYVHNFQKCFIHNYWLIDTYKDKAQERPVRIVVDEGFEVFKKMKKLLCIK